MMRVSWWAALVFAVACASTRAPPGGAFEPRFVAVHNAFAALGFAQVGPIHEGALAEGKEARIGIDLAAGCTTIAVVGGEGVRDVDATLVDSSGHPMAHDTTAEPQAVLHVCVEQADGAMLLVKIASGAGTWVAAVWHGDGAGGGASSAAAAGSSGSKEPNGTCEAPIPLAPGTVTGSTAHGEHDNAGSCDQSDSREVVYELDAPQRERVTIEVEARFDSVLYLRKDDCADPDAEVDCSDDAPDRTHSRIERVIEPGRYFVFVDGYSHDEGSFKMTVSVADVVALADECRRAPLLAPGAKATGTTLAAANRAGASCGAGAEGADAPWQVHVASRSRVRVVEHSDDMAPVVHVRRSCPDEQSEVACGEPSNASADAVVTGVFDAGSYAVFADARDHDAAGRYSLELELAPPAGAGVAGDACADALPLGAGPSVSGDTFEARDDVSGSCGGASAADVVYRVEVARRSRFVASLRAEEARHLLVAWRRCGDRATEVACGSELDEVLGPGTYFVGVDGSSEDALGRFTLAWSMQDLASQDWACRGAPALSEGAPVTGTTSGAGNKFAVSCGAGRGSPSGPDRVYKIVADRRVRAHIALAAPSFQSALALRNACPDASGGPRSAELACEAEADLGQRTAIDATLEKGTYWVVVDGQTPNDEGPFTLEYRAER